MRRVAILSAGAALVLALVVPAMAEATGRTTTPDKSTAISAQSVSLDTPIAAQWKGGHHKGGGHKSTYRKGYRRGYRDGRHDSRYRHGYHRHYYGGGRCYGCYGPGSRCDRYGCDYAYGYPYYYGGYWGGGYGCNFDYPCGPPYERNDCSKNRDREGKPPADSGCKYDQKCDCYYQSSQPAPEAGAQPGPDQNAQPAPPDQNAQPAPPDQNAQPGPDQGQQPPDQGTEPAPGDGQPRPY